MLIGLHRLNHHLWAVDVVEVVALTVPAVSVEHNEHNAAADKNQQVVLSAKGASTPLTS